MKKCEKMRNLSKMKRHREVLPFSIKSVSRLESISALCVLVSFLFIKDLKVLNVVNRFFKRQTLPYLRKELHYLIRRDTPNDAQRVIYDDKSRLKFIRFTKFTSSIQFLTIYSFDFDIKYFQNVTNLVFNCELIGETIILPPNVISCIFKNSVYCDVKFPKGLKELQILDEFHNLTEIEHLENLQILIFNRAISYRLLFPRNLIVLKISVWYGIIFPESLKCLFAYNCPLTMILDAPPLLETLYINGNRDNNLIGVEILKTTNYFINFSSTLKSLWIGNYFNPNLENIPDSLTSIQLGKLCSKSFLCNNKLQRLTLELSFKHNVSSLSLNHFENLLFLSLPQFYRFDIEYLPIHLQDLEIYSDFNCKFGIVPKSLQTINVKDYTSDHDLFIKLLSTHIVFQYQKASHTYSTNKIYYFEIH